MRGRFTAAATVLLVSAVLSTNVLAQGGANASLSGTVSDATGALIPGVTITATNVNTGVVTTTLSNETGSYNFPSLQPGAYKASAELSGFQTQAFTDIELSAGLSIRQNFTLKVGAANTTVDVRIATDTLLAASSATIGEVLNERRVRDLPLVGSDVLSLLNIVAGVQGDAGASTQTFAGVSTLYSNTTINGISVSDGRYDLGINATNAINPDLVGEIRIILTPVDAEMGRGNGQVQITTRSGTNRFSGSAVYNVRNSALDANTWNNNRTGAIPGWTNRNQYTVSYGGPIVKNKTFFFGLFDQLITQQRANQNALVWTDCMRNGIFRYYPDWGNGNAVATDPGVTSSTTATRPSVDYKGNPNPPTIFRNGAPYTGTLQYRSVFGPLPAGWTPKTADCSDAPAVSSYWDPLRPNLDPSGFVTKSLKLMPEPNNFSQALGGGDGLNTAIYSWIQKRAGNDEVGFGTADFRGLSNRKQINIKIDENFNANHKANVGWQYERDGADNAAPSYPGGFWGYITRGPQIWTSQLTSTLSSTMVNEARFGLRRNVETSADIFTHPRTGRAASDFFPNVNGYPLYAQLGAGLCCLVSPNGFRFGGDSTFGDITSLYQYSDALSWTRGKHALKGGVDIRRGNSDGRSNVFVVPRPVNGAGTTLPFDQTAFTGAALAANFPCPTGASSNCIGLIGSSAAGNMSRLQNMTLGLSGSLASMSQLYFINSGKEADVWKDYADQQTRVRDWHQDEFDVFFKDDWKMTKDLTLNLGLRYDYYAPFYETHGLLPLPITATGAVGGDAMWGRTGGFENWWTYATQKDRNGNYIYPGADQGTQYIGPGSLNPDKSIWKKDRNNFGPAVGFAWQVPWFGEGKTTLRGGYQVTYQGGGRANDIDFDLGGQFGSVVSAASNASDQTYVRLADLSDKTKCANGIITGCLPVPLPIVNGQFLKPGGALPATGHNAAINGYEANYVSPYIQNFTLSVTRSLRRNLTVDVRYIGTRGVKLFSNSLDLNYPNFLTNGLKEAFDSARAGGNPALLDQMFNGVNLGGTGARVVGSVVSGVRWTGGDAIRTNTALNNNLAIGNYAGLAATLNNLDYSRTTAGNAGLPDGTVPGYTSTDHGTVLRYNGFPENFITANPQACVYTGGLACAEYKTNIGNSKYHSLQTQMTLRPTNGISYQGTYTWSRTLNLNSGYWTNPADRRLDYTLGGGHRVHDFRSNGTFELPIGPNKLLLGNSSGWFARLVERWQASTILQFTSGSAASITAQSMLYGNGRPDITREGVAYFGHFPAKFGTVGWPGVTDGVNGGYFPQNTFLIVPDPQCNPANGYVGASLQSLCEASLNAIARPLPDGTTGVPGQITVLDTRPGAAAGSTRPALIVLRNTLPATRGNLGSNTMENPGTWSFDASASKTFRIGESRSAQLRVDANNVFNHPTPANPTLNVNSDAPFGEITTKNGRRTFQASLRLNF